MSRKKTTLSVCLIVKNEEKMLSDCLRSVTDIADQIIVLDTGSEDATVEIAREHGAEVHHFVWCDDFSAARNESVRHANSDWILWLDADERLHPESLPVLQSLLKPVFLPTAYQVQINSLVQNGEVQHLSTAHRLFSNHHGILFAGRIHEQIAYSLAELQGEELHCTVRLDHLGYNGAEVNQTPKAERNLKLLNRMVTEQPENAYAHYTIAQQYGLCGNHSQALVHFETALKLNQFNDAMNASLLNTMSESLFALENYSRARLMAAHSVRSIPRQVGGYLLLYRLAVKEDDDELIEERLLELAKNNAAMEEGEKCISTDVIIPPDMLDNEFVRLYQRMQRYDDLLKHLRRMLKRKPDNTVLIERMALVHIARNDLKQTELWLQRLLEKDPAHPLCREYLGTVLIKQQKFREALHFYQPLLEAEPHNELARRRVAGLHAKLGNVAVAHGLLAEKV